MDRRRAAGALLALAACIACSTAAPTASNQTALDLYDDAMEGCYYNFQHYGEGDRIMTNEPCLNCTCHNRMLMCYLRVCPFTKPIGQDCTVEKRADQCCPIVTCPDVPVDLLTSTSTSSPAEYGATGVGKQDKYGCSINGKYFSEGSKVPPTPNKPCEHCYCIRNMTTCVMQECTLHVDGCIPIYHKDVCCPVRYSCDHSEDEIPLLDDMTTTVRPTPGFLLTTTLSPVTQVSQDCVHDDQIFADGALIKTEKACEHCYCMKGDIVCVVQECGSPMENEGKNCTSLSPRHGQCCPDTYICEGDEPSIDQPEVTTKEIFQITSTTPPRRGGVEGSGYRNEPDEPYTDIPIFDTLETEGSGEEEAGLPINEPEILTSEKQTPDLADEMFLTTAKLPESKPFTSIPEPDTDLVSNPKLSEEEEKSGISGIEESTINETDITTESTEPDASEGEEGVTYFENKDMEHFNEQDIKVTKVMSATTVSANDYVSSTLSGSLISREDEPIITTEPTFRTEEDLFTATEVTTQKRVDVELTQSEHYGIKEILKDDIGTKIDTTAKPEDELELASVEPISIEDTFQPKQTTTEMSLDIFSTSESNKNDKENTIEYISSTTKIADFTEAISINPIQNEIADDLLPVHSSGRIPGEGDCLLNGITYKNNTTVPSTNKCHTSCKCISSIIKCDPIICSPPPQYENIVNSCQPIYDSAESCCPTYICDHSKETMLPESHSQMADTESSKPALGNECNENECTVTEEKQQTLPKQPQPCSSENCVNVQQEKQPELPDCEVGDCGNRDEDSSLKIKPIEICSDGKCVLPPYKDLSCNEETGCHVTAAKPCEGNDCIKELEVIAEKQHLLCQTQGNCKDMDTSEINDTVEKECTNNSCRRKEYPEVTLTPSCIGDQCKNYQNTEITQEETTSNIPIVSEENSNHGYISTTSITEVHTVKPDEDLTNILEQETTSLDTSSQKVNINAKPEFTTKYPEYIPGITDYTITKELDTVTSIRPEVGRVPGESISEYGPSIEISTKLPENYSENEYLTTLSHNLLTEPTIAEENTETVQKLEHSVGNDENIQIQTQTPGIEFDATPLFELAENITTLSPESLITNTQEQTLTDHVKDSSPLVTNEITTPVTDSDKYSTGSYKTDSPVNKDKVGEFSNENSSTTSNKYYDGEHSTESFVTKAGVTSSILFDDISTKLQEVHEYIEKTTDSTTPETLDRTVQYIETTNKFSEHKDIESQDKISTQKSSVITSSNEKETTTEYTVEEKTTSQVNDYNIAQPHNTSSVIPGIQKHEKEQQTTTELAELYITEEGIMNTKDTDQQHLYTNLPVTEDTYLNESTKTPEQSIMESLNGRGTELPGVDDIEGTPQTETSQLSEKDMHTIISEQVTSGLEETQTKSSKPESTESTFDTSQKALEEDVGTKFPEYFVNETTNIVTNAPTLFITESAVRDQDITDLNQGVEDTNESVFSTDTSDKITTERLETLDHHQSDNEINKERVTEPILETTLKPEVPSTVQFEGIQSTELSSDSHKYTSQAPLISQTDETLTTSFDKDLNIASHENELSTSGLYSEVEMKTELYTENFVDITTKTEQQWTEKETHMNPTESSDVSLLPTTMLPIVSSENIIHTSISEEKVTESAALLTTEDISSESLPIESVKNLVTASNEETVTPKQSYSEEATLIPELTEGSNSSKIEGIEKTTVSSHISEDSREVTSNFVVNLEEDKYEKTTAIPEMPLTEEPHVTIDKTTMLTDIVDINKDVPEMVTSKIFVTQPEIYTDNLSITTIRDHEEKTDELEKFDIVQSYTKTPDMFTEQDNLSQLNKDKSTEIPNVPTTPHTEELEIQTKETSEIPNREVIIKSTETPDLHISGEVQTEETEYSSVKSPEMIEQAETSDTKELHGKVTESDNNVEVTSIPEKLATTSIEYVTEKATSSSLVEYTEKLTETPEQIYTAKTTELPEISSKATDFDLITIADLVTETAEITSESSTVNDKQKLTTVPDHKLTDKSSVDVLKTEKETTSEVPESEDIVTLAEISTYKPVISTEKISTEQFVTKDLYTDLPQVVTENISQSENIDNSHTGIPEFIHTTHSDLPDFETGVPEISDSKNQDYTTGKPEVITDATEIYVPTENLSYLPETGNDDKVEVAVTEEKYTEHSTEVSENALNKPEESADTESNKINTVTLELPTTEKSVDLLEDGVVKITESPINKDTDEPSKISEHISTLEPNYQPGLPDSAKTTTEVPDLYPTRHSESGILDETTLEVKPEISTQISTLLSTVKQETSTQSEKGETTSEKKLLESAKVSVDGEDKTGTYIPEQYTKLPEQIFTEQHKSSTKIPESLEQKISESDKTITVTYSPEMYLTTLQEQAFSHNLHEPVTTVPESSITQKVESVTQLSLTSSTHGQSTEELLVTAGVIDVTKSPQSHEYTTEIYDMTTHALRDKAIDQETTQTELPELDITSQGSIHNVLDEKISTKIPDTKVTERLEASTQQDIDVSVVISTESNELESKPIFETTKLPEYSKQTSETKYGYPESTPYLVELEEHTHKSIQETTPEDSYVTELYTDDVETTSKSVQDISTDKQILHDEENQTEGMIKATKVSTKEDSKTTTPISDYGGQDAFQTTEYVYKISSEPTIQSEKQTTLSDLNAENKNEEAKYTPTVYDKETSTAAPVVTTVIYEKQETPKYEKQATSVSDREKESSEATDKPYESENNLHMTTSPVEEFIPAVTKVATTMIPENVTTVSPSFSHHDKFTRPEEKPSESPSTSAPELQKPGLNEVLPTDDIPSTDEDGHFPPTGTSGYGQEPDYVEEDQAFGPGTCRYGGKVYVSAQQIPRDDPCDFCFCFRSDIICLQQSCPPPIHGCHEEPIQGFCCPRYECPVSMATTLNITTTTTTTTTTLPPHFLPHAYKGAAQRRGCQIKGHTYKVGEVVRASSGPCLHCTCGGDGQMKCDPKACTPEPMLRQMIAAAVSAKRRR